MNIEYSIENNEPVIYFYKRENGIRKCDRITGFRPYFYINEGESVPKDSRITGTESGYKNILEEPVKKVYCKLPGDVGNVRNLFSKTYEADIQYTKRWVVDNNPDFGEEFSILFVDIECWDKNGFPEPEKAKEKVLAITAFCTQRQKYWTLYIDDKESEIEKTRIGIIDKKEYPWMIKAYTSETAMLNDFLDLVRYTDSDILSGWNSYRFDFEYLINRMKILNIDFRKLSPLGRVKEGYYRAGLLNPREKYREPMDVAGRLFFDCLMAYKRIQRKGIESYSLEYVSQKELGTGKIGHGKRTWEMTKEELIEYNCMDVELTKEIEVKRKVISYFWGMANFIKCWITETQSFSRMGDTFMLRKKGNMIFPTVQVSKSDTFEGGRVFDPPMGRYEDVVVFDLTSLYPSIIMSLNISIDTQSTKEEADIHIDELGVYINGKKKGFIPKVMEDLFNERDKYRKILESGLYKRGTDEWLLAWNKSEYVKQLANCFAEGTIITCKDGFKDIEDVRIGEEVVSINPKTLKKEWKKVIDKREFDAPDKMIRFKTNSNKEILVTEEHHMATHNKQSRMHHDCYRDELELKMILAKDLDVEKEGERGGKVLGTVPVPINKFEKDRQYQEYFNIAKHLKDIDGLEIYINDINNRIDKRTVKCAIRKYSNDINKFRVCSSHNLNCKLSELSDEFLDCMEKVEKEIPVRFFISTHMGKKQPCIYKMNDFLKFMGWYTSEGSKNIPRDKIDKNGTKWSANYSIGMTQYIPDGREELENLLKNMNLNYNKGSCGFSISGKPFWSFMKKYGVDLSSVKHLPDFFMELPIGQLENYAHGHWWGDGSFHNTGIKHKSISIKLIDQLEEIYQRMGHQYTRFDDGIAVYNDHSKGDKYLITKNDVKFEYIKEREIITDSLPKKVYDLTVEDNHTLIANGIITFQSVYGMFAYKGFRLYVPKLSESTTYIGRKTLDWTKKIAQENGYTVIYGDTDSVFITGWKNGTPSEIMDESEVLRDKINKSYDEFVKQFGIKNHRLSIKSEELFETLTFIGVKKRYFGKMVFKRGEKVDLLEIVGFETKRSDASNFTRAFQKEFMMMVSNKLSETELIKFVNEKIDLLKKASVMDIAFGKAIIMDIRKYKVKTNVIRAALYSNMYMGKNYDSGDKPRFIYVKKVRDGLPKVDEDKRNVEAICFDNIKDIEGFEIDYNRLADLQICKKVNPILGALGYREITSDVSQTVIGDYFG